MPEQGIRVYKSLSDVGWSPKWITFVELHNGAGKKTRLWQLQAKDGGAILGYVRWYPAWRKYSFFPAENTLFEPDCLRDIAQFLSIKTAERKNERAAEKAAGGK